jgi:hypothetical protein
MHFLWRKYYLLCVSAFYQRQYLFKVQAIIIHSVKLLSNLFGVNINLKI